MSKIDYPFNTQPGDLLGSEEFLYDGLGRLAAKKNGENKVTAYEYDQLNRVSKVSYNYGSFVLPIVISSPDVSYIYKGNTSLVEHMDTRRDILGESGGDATRRASYTYYKDGRMKSYSPAVPVGYGSLEYTWNSIGQKTSMKVPAGVGNLVRMLEYRYDSTGRQVGLDVRMSTAVSSTGTATPQPDTTTRFFYDASQNRTKLINKAGDVYYFVYDPTASFPAAVYEQGPEYRYVNVREPDGALVSREKYDGLGQRVANSIYHFDGLGNTRAISDGNGNVTDTYSYDAWGNTTHTSGTTADNPYQYVGRYGYYTHYQEPDFHLLQLGVRYYDPGMGRFTQRDRLPGHLLGFAPYLYIDDKPTARIDPTGLWVTDVTNSCKGLNPGNRCTPGKGDRCEQCCNDLSLHGWQTIVATALAAGTPGPITIPGSTTLSCQDKCKDACYKYPSRSNCIRDFARCILPTTIDGYLWSAILEALIHSL